MRVKIKGALLFAALLILAISTWHQFRQIAHWQALHCEVLALRDQIKARTHQREIPEPLTALFSQSGGWQNLKVAPRTSRQILLGRAVVEWKEAFSALFLATRCSLIPGMWRLQKWQVRGLDAESERCELELTIAKEEGL